MRTIQKIAKAAQSEGNELSSDGRCGPFSCSSHDHEGNSIVPVRNLRCKNYEQCLELAIALRWESFSCETCSGTINETLRWRVDRHVFHDKVARYLCPSTRNFTVLKSDQDKS